MSLATDQNIFILELYSEYERNVHTLCFNLRVFSSKLEERLRNYSCFIRTSPIFQGTISNWTIDSKAVSWTGVGYSFVISTSIKQINALELIVSVPFAFGSCCCEPTSYGQRNYSVKHATVRLQKQNKSKERNPNSNQGDSRNIRSGLINSLVHSEKKRKH